MRDSVSTRVWRDGPLVTVYIPCHDYGRYLAAAVESVLLQLYGHWELFIIDEGSSDETSAVAERFRALHPEKIRVIRHAAPHGLQRTANEILGLARGRYLVRLDADDWFDESALLVMVARLEADPELNLVYGNYYYTDPDGAVLGMERRLKLGAEDRAGHAAPHGACTMIRVRALKAAGGYSETVDAQDGWDVWYKLNDRNGAASIEAPLFYYRQHDDALSRDGKRLLHARGRIISDAGARRDGAYTPSCLAVVPVRESYPGFQGVPFRRIGGRSLLERAIRSAQRSRYVTEVVVSAASPKVLEFSARLADQGVVNPHLRVSRPPELAGGYILPRDIMAHAAEEFRRAHNAHPDIILFLSIHAPLRTADQITETIQILRVNGCDSVVSVCGEREPMFTPGEKGLTLLNPGRFQGLTYERELLYRFNGTVLASWWETLAEGDLFGQSIGYLEMTEADSRQVKSKRDLVALQRAFRKKGPTNHG